MAQKLEQDLNIIQRSGIEIQIDPLTKDLDIIQKLDDEPNDVGGLSAQELKAKFDEAGNTIKDFINDSLIPQVLGDGLNEQSRQEHETQRQENETARQTAESQRAEAETARQAAESARVSAEEGREEAEGQRETAESEREAAFSAAQNQRAETFSESQAEKAKAFTESQTERAETFAESQAQRAAAFAASQEDREARFESEEARRNLWEDYDPETAYVPGNKVYYLGSSYVNTAACTGISPYDEAHWQIVAKKGQDGEGASPYDYALTAGYEGTEDAFKENFGAGPWLPMSGGTMTGPLRFARNQALYWEDAPTGVLIKSRMSFIVGQGVVGYMASLALEAAGAEGYEDTDFRCLRFERHTTAQNGKGVEMFPVESGTDTGSK